MEADLEGNWAVVAEAGMLSVVFSLFNAGKGNKQEDNIAFA